jgi:hypothetical protein
MSIIVVCRNCLQRFKVSDKFAGKKGPCPKCKKILRVPLKDEEVKIHTAEHSEQAAKGKSGELVLEPVSREQTQLSWWLLGFVGILVLGAVVLALTFQGAAESTKSLLACSGVVLLAPPLAIVGYWFLRNADLESYTGLWLWIRTGICCLVYILCWAVYGFLVPGEWTDELWKWAFLGPVFGVVGATAAFACYDLDYSSGFFHFAFYVGVTTLLGMLMGLPVVGG